MAAAWKDALARHGAPSHHHSPGGAGAPALGCSSASRCADGSGKCQRSPRVCLTLHFQSQRHLFQQKHLFQQTENKNLSKKQHFVRAGGFSPPRPTLWPPAPRVPQGRPLTQDPTGVGQAGVLGVPGSQLQTSEPTAPSPGQAPGPEESSRGPRATLPSAHGPRSRTQPGHSAGSAGRKPTDHTGFSEAWLVTKTGAGS